MELFLDNHLRCVKYLNAISKYMPNARLTKYLLIFFVFMTNPSKNPSNYKNLIKSNHSLTFDTSHIGGGSHLVQSRAIQS